MSAGQTLAIFTPLHAQPLSASYATIDVRNSHPVLDFDAAAEESTIFGSILSSNYSGNGLVVRIHWAASTATSGDVKWEASIERMDSTFNLDVGSFAAAQSVTTTTAGTAGLVNVSTIALTSGAQMDNLVAAESFRIKIVRDSGDAADTMTGDAELLRVEIVEAAS